MATLRELNRHYQSVRTVGQISGAMRSIATADYSRLTGRYDTFSDYSRELSRLQRSVGSDTPLSRASDPDAPVLYVVLTAPRGLCGAYSSDLNSFVKELTDGETRSFEVKEVVFSNIPDANGSDELESELEKSFSAGDYSEITIVHQSFVNMMTQKPVCETLFPVKAEQTDGVSDTVLIPSEEAISLRLSQLQIKACVYRAMLDAAISFSSATMMAMHEAYDNAQESAGKIGLAISRKRQAEITASVIETASGNEAEE